MKSIKILNKTYGLVDAKDKITVADSFVVRQNKIGGGNGEAKLYVGNDNKELRSFFGKKGFKCKCFLLKSDLLKYLDETQNEYLKPEQPYIHKVDLPAYWKDRKTKVALQNDFIRFDVSEQTQIVGSRVYVNSNEIGYKLIRELSLPNITYISIVKINDNLGDVYFYFRLFADYFGEAEHPFLIQKEEEKINGIQNEVERVTLIKARIGQGDYRKKLLDLCPVCPITLISDERLLIASHIKPWANSSNFEKTDPLNGFMLSPMFDYLFDRGFISFKNDKRIILSPFLSNMTYSKIGISDNKTYSHLPVKGREKYLEYHRDVLLKR